MIFLHIFFVEKQKNKMYKTDIVLLSNDKIVILTYNELINTAKSIYRFDVEDE